MVGSSVNKCLEARAVGHLIGKYRRTDHSRHVNSNNICTTKKSAFTSPICLKFLLFLSNGWPTLSISHLSNGTSIINTFFFLQRVGEGGGGNLFIYFEFNVGYMVSAVFPS